MYRGETYLHHDRINSVLRTAEALQVKGLSEGPRNFEVHEKSGGSGSGGPSGGGGPSTSGVGGGNNSSASNARVLSSPSHESSPLRSTVGIMGTRPIMKNRDHHHQRGGHPADPPRNSDLHNRDLDGSPPSSHHHLLSRGGSDSSRSHHRALSPPNSDHGNFAYPPPRGGEGFGMYGRAFSSNAGIAAFTNRDYSPSSSTRDRSPPPDRVRSYGSASSLPITTKEERDDNYEGGRHSTSRSGSLVLAHHDRGTPVSDKASDRHTPASHHGGGGVDRERERDYEQRSSRNSPPSPMATPTNSLGRTTPASERAFPSDSTSDLARVAHSSTLKERIRRLSDSAAPTLAVSGAGDPDPDRKYQDFRREADVSRTRSPAPRG